MRGSTQLAASTDESEHGSAALHLQRVLDTAGDASELARLRQTNEDLQAFAAMAAHDLRSPLAVISMYAELVSEELEDGSFDPATAGERLHRIRRAADRGVALVEDLLAYASIGSESLDIGAVDLTMLAQTVAAEHQASADRRVHVKVEMLPEVEGSLPLLRQLLSNLIGNAVKYTPTDREVQIRVDTAAGRSPDWMTIRITDNGDPIPAEDRERLFVIFQRGKHQDVPGSGVGLAICQRVAEAHGGRVLLDPDYTDGNRFCIELAATRSLTAAYAAARSRSILRPRKYAVPHSSANSEPRKNISGTTRPSAIAPICSTQPSA